MQNEVFEAQGNDEEFTCKCGHTIQKRESGFKCLKNVFCEACQTKWNNERKDPEHTILCYPLCHINLMNNQEHQHTKFQRT
jgi:hypothetical protein